MAIEWRNPYPTCRHGNYCKCSGGIHSYFKAYDRFLDKFDPKSVFEWGPGPNTIKALERGAKVFCIEQKEQFVPKVADEYKDRFEFLVTPFKGDEYVCLHGRKDFDVYFVDSRRRPECIQLVHEEAKKDCIVCLHDAQRRPYHKSLKLFDYVNFLHKGFAIASNNPTIMELE